MTKPYDTTGQAVFGFDSAPDDGGFAAFSFTNTTAGTLAQVQLELEDIQASTDGGSVTLSLYSSSSTSPGAKIATLGTIADTALSATGSLFTLAAPGGIALAANTRYWIEITGSATSQALYGYERDASGTGASAEFYDDNGTIASNSAGAPIASVSVTEAACYCRGTLILTEHGEVAVEDLAIGDRVVTASGTPEVIRWLGRRSYAGQFVGSNHLMLPVCFKAGSLADGVPHRDLHVSPGHAMFVAGRLVPAWRLINGVSVVQPVSVESVTYYHIELDRHAIILADGAPAESFLDDNCRGQFHNAAEFAALYPDAPAMVPFAPRLEDGFGLQALQERIALRAGLFTPVDTMGALRGFLDVGSAGRICGWAQDIDSPEEPVALEVSVGGHPVLCLLANAYRGDLRVAGMGSGCHAFDMALPDQLQGVVAVRRVIDGLLLPATIAAEPESALRAA